MKDVNFGSSKMNADCAVVEQFESVIGLKVREQYYPGVYCKMFLVD